MVDLFHQFFCKATLILNDSLYVSPKLLLVVVGYSIFTLIDIILIEANPKLLVKENGWLVKRLSLVTTFINCNYMFNICER